MIDFLINFSSSQTRKFDVRVNSPIETQLSKYCQQIKLESYQTKTNIRELLQTRVFHLVSDHTIVPQKRVKVKLSARAGAVIRNVSRKRKVVTVASNDSNNNTSEDQSFHSKILTEEEEESDVEEGDEHESYPLGCEDSLMEECDAVSEDSEDPPLKPVPAWAQPDQLENSLNKQEKIEPKLIFTAPDSPDLDLMFPARGRRRRNIWVSPRRL